MIICSLLQFAFRDLIWRPFCVSHFLSLLIVRAGEAGLYN